ncbi:MAG TPA: hypothetical protein VME20_03465 [Acidimicrobiales bacterium]|nr:hypothetical protein [Acidimicrobiales bacterium]
MPSQRVIPQGAGRPPGNLLQLAVVAYLSGGSTFIGTRATAG